MAGHEDDELVLATMAHEGGYIRLGMSAGEPWRATGRSVRAFARTFEQDKETRYLVLVGAHALHPTHACIWRINHFINAAHNPVSGRLKWAKPLPWRKMVT